MKSILTSVKPEEVEKILNGKLRVLRKKTRLKCELPCKVYIYETKGKKHFYSYIEACECPSEQDRIEYWEYGCGKVVAYFTLNKIEKYNIPKPGYRYVWYIDDLKIYDVPKELSEVVLPNKKHCKTCFLYKDMCENVCGEIKNHLFRPPQSWCYVESLEGE